MILLSADAECYSMHDYACTYIHADMIDSHTHASMCGFGASRVTHMCAVCSYTHVCLVCAHTCTQTCCACVSNLLCVCVKPAVHVCNLYLLIYLLCCVVLVANARVCILCIRVCVLCDIDTARKAGVVAGRPTSTLPGRTPFLWFCCIPGQPRRKTFMVR